MLVPQNHTTTLERPAPPYRSKSSVITINAKLLTGHSHAACSVTLQNIPANILSGFLGTGKTTAILSLFQQKPANEKWAVLVNEFGKVGIDGKLYQQEGIAVKEIPGGCMCCAQGLPLQVAINRLLNQSQPDRLLIESSGVGHPSGVLKTLQGKGFNQVLTLKAGICLIDPMHLLDTRYQSNALFLEQIQLGDVLVANKTDLATAAAMQAFDELARKVQSDKALITHTRYAQLETDWLDLDHSEHKTDDRLRLLPDSHPWQSHTFEFDDTTVFDHDALLQWLQNQSLMRIKGLVMTTRGAHTVNATPYSAELAPLSATRLHSQRNLLEIIDRSPDAGQIQSDLEHCITTFS